MELMQLMWLVNSISNFVDLASCMMHLQTSPELSRNPIRHHPGSGGSACYLEFPSAYTSRVSNRPRINLDTSSRKPNALQPKTPGSRKQDFTDKVRILISLGHLPGPRKRFIAGTDYIGEMNSVRQDR